MVDGTMKDISSLKFLLLCFQEMSCLAINFTKSKVIVMGYSNEENVDIANKLNYRLSVFPMTYLGLPVSDGRVRFTELRPVVAKVEHCVHPWQGRLTSKAGKSMFITSSMSSLPMFAMGHYLFPEAALADYDKFQCRFFWQDDTGRQKYHMVKWSDICMPKDEGGLCIASS
ncbi:hypothetical protein D1007_18913 [Hordeum vulgare]|nr:hypothetical protein D1007_18913 [Hordeum vulgare]